MANEQKNDSDSLESMPGVDESGTLGFRRTLMLVILACIIYPLFLSFTGARTVESQSARKIEYVLRDKLGQLPPVDPQIKIISWDEKTTSYLADRKRYPKDLPLEAWARVIKFLAAKGPTSIILSSDFALPFHPEGAAKLAEVIRSVSPHVFVESLVWKDPVPGRPLLLPEKMLKSPDGVRQLKSRGVDQLVAHGAEIQLSKEQAVRFGHLDPGEDGYVMPWFVTGKGRVLPHASLRAFNPETSDFKILPAGFRINGRNVPIDSMGRVLIDFPRMEALSSLRNSISLADVLKAAEENTPFEFIRSGDYVFLLADSYIGGEEYRNTYAGRIESGLMSAAVLNSALTGNWFRYVEGGIWLGLLLIVVAAAMGLYLPPAVFATAYVSVLFVMVMGSVVAAVYFKTIVSWLYPTVFFGVTGIAVFIEAHRQSMVRDERLRSSLGGILAPKQVQELIKRGVATRPEPSEQNVSILFVDIVGFSKIAEEARPKEVFAQLRALMIKMRSLVHEYGGVVDRSLGDGMVAFFGYDYTGEKRISDHAGKALRCAIDMQVFAAKEAISAAKKGTGNVFPLRIGINTGVVFIGDLGDENRVDFTLIGHGVNMAQRLEAACESFGVMVGPQTRESVQNDGEMINRLEKRAMQIKHHDELIDAFELDCFAGQKQILRQAMDAYRSMHNLQRQSERHTPERGSIKVMIKVSTDHGQGELVDFSLGGFSVKLDTYLARGVVTQLTLDSKDGQLGESCREFGLFPVPVEVRWGAKVNGGYLHGFEIKGLNDVQRGLLHRELRGHTAGHGSSRRWSVPEGLSMKLDTNIGASRIVNFSMTGLGLTFENANLEVDQQIELCFDQSPSPVNEIGQAAGVKRINAIVRRTGGSQQPGYCGVEIAGLDEDERLRLFRGLQNLIRPSKAA